MYCATFSLGQIEKLHVSNVRVAKVCVKVLLVDKSSLEQCHALALFPHAIVRRWTFQKTVHQKGTPITLHLHPHVLPKRLIISP